MPHRTTYFFPRHFPDNRTFDNTTSSSSSSPRQLLEDHEKLLRDHNFSNSSNTATTNLSTSTAEKVKPEVVHEEEEEEEESKLISRSRSSRSPSPAAAHLNSQSKRPQFAGFRDWLTNTKRTPGEPLSLDESQELLLPHQHQDIELVPPLLPPVDQFRRVSLQRASSEDSSYAGSSVECFSHSDFKQDSSRLSVITSESKEEEQEVEGDKRASVAQKTRESYYLQLTFARRLSAQASMSFTVEPSLIMKEGGNENDVFCADVETVSYRLWVCNLV